MTILRTRFFLLGSRKLVYEKKRIATIEITVITTANKTCPIPSASPTIMVKNTLRSSLASPWIERKRISENAPRMAIDVPRLPLIMIITAITRIGSVARVIRKPLLVWDVFMCVNAIATPRISATPAQISAVLMSSPVIVESNILLNIFFLSYFGVYFAYFAKLLGEGLVF